MLDHLTNVICKNKTKLKDDAKSVTSKFNVRIFFYNRFTTSANQIMKNNNKSLFVKQNNKNIIDAENEQRSQKLQIETKTKCVYKKFSNDFNKL